MPACAERCGFAGAASRRGSSRFACSCDLGCDLSQPSTIEARAGSARVVQLLDTLFEGLTECFISGRTLTRAALGEGDEDAGEPFAVL